MLNPANSNKVWVSELNRNATCHCSQSSQSQGSRSRPARHRFRIPANRHGNYSLRVACRAFHKYTHVLAVAPSMLRSSKHHLPGTPLYGQVPFGLLNTERLLRSDPASEQLSRLPSSNLLVDLKTKSDEEGRAIEESS